MKADIINLTYKISRSEFNDLVRNTLLIKEVIDNGGKIVNLGTLLESTKYGYTASALQSGNVKLIRITDLKDNFINIETVPFCNCKNYEDYLVKNGDILIGRTGTVGKSFLLDYDLEYKSIYASYLIRLRANKIKVLPEFIYLFLNSYYFWNQLHEIKAGAVKMNINANKIKDLEIPYCSIEEQKKILQKIKELTTTLENTLEKIGNIYLVDDGINKNINYIKQLKQVILQEAVEGKLTKSWRENNPNTELASILLDKVKKEKEELIKQKKLKKQEKSKEISDNEIPFEIPESWSWCRLGDIFNELKIGGTPSRSQSSYFGGKNLWVSIRDMTGKDFIHETKEHITDLGIKNSNCKLVTKGSLLMSFKLSVGLIAFAGKDLYTNEAIVAFEKNDTIIDLNLLKYFLLKVIFLGVVKNMMGANMLNKEKIINSIFPLPPLEEQKEIVKKVDELMNYCDLLEKQSLETKENSENLMKSVLSEVFSR